MQLINLYIRDGVTVAVGWSRVRHSRVNINALAGYAYSLGASARRQQQFLIYCEEVGIRLCVCVFVFKQPQYP